MKKIQGLNCILLVDDDPATNFISRIAVKQQDLDVQVEAVLNGQEALNYLKAAAAGERPRPDLIFLDINMPLMNGWEFLTAYEALPESVKQSVIVAMLTTSLNPDDAQRAFTYKSVKDFVSKPLTGPKVGDVLQHHFKTDA